MRDIGQFCEQCERPPGVPCADWCPNTEGDVDDEDDGDEGGDD
jgi:hypothetical protein